MTIIADRYELEERLGVGGMAEVFLATDRTLGRKVAVKVLNRGYAEQPEFVERFKREARAAARLEHPNVVPIYEWGASDDTYYIVMGYVPGEDLKKVIRDRGPLPEDEALRIATGVAAALEAAHQQGIVHRDIKPHNILLDDAGQPRVTDFGIAQAAGLSQLTETSVVLGTAVYLSPEQASRRPIDARSDIYSLGIVTYEMLAGQPPFSGHSVVDLAMQHVNDPPRPLRELRPEVSPATEQVVMRAIEKDPGHRFQSAQEMSDALDRALSFPAGATAATTVMPGTGETATVPAAAAGVAGAPRSASVRPQPRRRAAPDRLWPALALLMIALLAAIAFIIFQLGNQSPGDDVAGPGANEVASEDPTPTPEPEAEPTPEPEEPEEPAAGDEPAQDEEPTAPEGDGEAEPEDPAASEGEGEEETGQEDPLNFQGDVTCTQTIGAATVDSVTVPGGATCVLDGTTTNDEVHVEPGGVLRAANAQLLDNVTVDGGEIELTGNSYVDGNLTVTGGGPALISGARVDGNVELDGNSGSLVVENSVIDGNLQAYDNSGGVSITGNQIDGNLQCDGNQPPPTGSGNSVQGNMEDQCAGF
jgi:hypothetical protein